jgi:hypothetical protein
LGDPNHEFLPSEVSQMEVKFQDKSMKPWVSPRPDPVVGTQGGLKVERGRLSLAPLGSEGRVESPNGSNASTAGLPNGLVVRWYKRLGVTYRVTNYETVIRLVAELLFHVRSSKGGVVYMNAGKLVRYLGLSGTIHPIDLSVIYATMARLGFEVVEASRGKAAIINMGHPLIEKIKAAKDVNETIEIIRKYLR